MNTAKETETKVVLFDGVCNLCNTSVDFIVRYEKEDTLKFASLQSEYGKALVQKAGMTDVPDSILFYSNGELQVKSKAVLSICSYLKFPYRLLNVFRFVPKPIVDKFYEYIARNRYRWFGTKDSCRVPTAEERGKFLA